MRNKLILLVTLSFLVKIVLSAITYHSDVIPYVFAGQVIKGGNILNFYDYLWNLPESSQILKVYPRNLFNYPPMVYFSLGGISLLTMLPFGSMVGRFILETSTVLGSLNVNFLLLFIKLPYFVVDGLCAYFVWKLFNNKRNQFLALALWLFNPVNLYATYMVGQFDIIPVLFVLWTLSSIKDGLDKGNKESGFIKEAVLLGLGASFKIYPLMFLIPLAVTQKKLFDRLKIIAVGVLTYFVTILPFVFSASFRKTALVAGQTLKSFYASLPISGGEAIIVYLAVLGFVYLTFWIKGLKPKNIWRAFFIIILLFFTFTHYHPQWFLWITPFLLIDLVLSKFRHLPLVLVSLLSMFGLVLFFDAGLSLGLFSAINPSLNGLPLLFANRIDYNLARSVLHTIFVSSALYYFLHNLRKLKILESDK